MEKSKVFVSFPSGPLDVYRKRASFDWYEMKKFINGSDILDIKEEIWATLSKDPLFTQSTKGLSVDEKRHLTWLRIKRLIEYDFMGDVWENPYKVHAFTDAVGSINWGLATKYQLQFQVNFQNLYLNYTK